jgi:hypothetical protein
MKHFVNESSDIGVLPKGFRDGGVHNEYQIPTKNRKACCGRQGCCRRPYAGSTGVSATSGLRRAGFGGRSSPVTGARAADSEAGEAPASYRPYRQRWVITPLPKWLRLRFRNCSADTAEGVRTHLGRRKALPIWRGTDGSNPSPSCWESMQTSLSGRNQHSNCGHQPKPKFKSPSASFSGSPDSSMSQPHHRQARRTTKPTYYLSRCDYAAPGGRSGC